ncbi:MAG: diguanylate cyclase, partial [Thermomonas sp.]
MTNLIRQRSRLGLWAAACIFMAISVGIVLGAQRLIADAASVSHAHQVIGTIDELEARLRDAEAAQRGYLLTADPDYLADYRSATATLPDIQSRLLKLVADNPAQLANAQTLWIRIDERSRQILRTLGRYREGGLAAAQAAITRDVFAASTAIRQQALAMRNAERELLAERGTSTNASGNLLLALAVLGIPIGMLVIWIVYRLLGGEIGRRAQAEKDVADANQQLRVGLDHVERGSADLRALTEYGSMLQSCMTPEEALQLTKGILSNLLPGVSGSIYRIRNSQDHAELAVHWGALALSPPAMISVDACWALRRGQVHESGLGHTPVCPHLADDAGPVATVCVPLMAQGAQLGLLCLLDPEHAYPARLGIVSAVVEHLSMALATLSLQDRLRQQSIRDPLSGLYNRRYLEESAQRELTRCERRGQPLSLLMLDIDHFKKFNDTHGHPGGDALLAQFGQLLQAMTRGEDIACRYGGEEFTLILPEAGGDAAFQRAEAIRVAVEAMQVAHLGAALGKVTVSIGVATFPDHGAAP